MIHPRRERHADYVFQTLLSTPEYSNGTPGSWRYWAITVPLTFTVMLTLLSWMWWIKHGQQKEDAKEHEPQAEEQGGSAGFWQKGRITDSAPMRLHLC